jgi:hypothetical protein
MVIASFLCSLVFLSQPIYYPSRSKQSQISHTQSHSFLQVRELSSVCILYTTNLLCKSRKLTRPTPSSMSGPPLNLLAPFISPKFQERYSQPIYSLVSRELHRPGHISNCILFQTALFAQSLAPKTSFPLQSGMDRKSTSCREFHVQSSFECKRSRIEFSVVFPFPLVQANYIEMSLLSSVIIWPCVHSLGIIFP